MPKTKKKFDWEVYDKHMNFLDILTMSRDEAKNFQKQFPECALKEIRYTDDD